MQRKRREHEVEARKLAFKAARLMMNEKISQKDAIDRVGSNRYAISQAALILQHGTEVEIAAGESGEMSIATIYEDILSRTTRSERLDKRFGPKRTEAVRHDQQIEADVWKNLRTAISLINSLPSVSDTVTIVRKNNQRMEYVSRSLLASLEWIQGFSDEITR